MSHRLACEMADVFGAVASVAGANGAPACEPSRAIPVLGIHGTTVFVIPFSSGRRAAVDWAERNGCDESPTRERFGSSYCDRWSGCEDGASVEFCSASGWTHLWPTEGSSIPASSRIWEFFEQHPLD